MTAMAASSPEMQQLIQIYQQFFDPSLSAKALAKIQKQGAKLITEHDSLSKIMKEYYAQRAQRINHADASLHIQRKFGIPQNEAEMFKKFGNGWKTLMKIKARTQYFDEMEAFGAKTGYDLMDYNYGQYEEPYNRYVQKEQYLPGSLPHAINEMNTDYSMILIASISLVLLLCAMCFFINIFIGAVCYKFGKVANTKKQQETGIDDLSEI